jgi:predicted outer membrane lipoprotein
MIFLKILLGLIFVYLGLVIACVLVLIGATWADALEYRDSERKRINGERK